MLFVLLSEPNFLEKKSLLDTSEYCSHGTIVRDIYYIMSLSTENSRCK